METYWLPAVRATSQSRALHLIFLNQGAEKVVKIWSPETGDFLRNLIGHTQGLSDIAWSSDSVYLASASDDTTIRIWNVENVRPPYIPVVGFSDLQEGIDTQTSKRTHKMGFLSELQSCLESSRIWGM